MESQPNYFRLSLLAVVIAAMGYFAGKRGEIGPQPTPAAPRGPDLVSVFKASDNPDARQHCLLFGDICAKCADTLEVDAKRGPQRLLESGADFAEYRTNLSYYVTSGWKFSSHYPRLKESVGNWLDAEAGSDPRAMDAEQTQRWVEAFRAMSNSAEYAADRIK